MLPFLPVVWAFVDSPRRAWFNLAGFQLLYRRNEWPNWFSHDLGVATAWANCPGAILLVVLAAAGIVRARRIGFVLEKDVFLVAALAVAETLYLINIHPGFTRYYLLAVPFGAILAGYGFASYLNRWWVAAAFTLTLGLGLAHYIPDDLDEYTWQGFEEIGRKIDQVTPPGAPIYADEHAYFTAHRLPPEGMSFAYSHKVALPPAEAAALGIVSRSELDRRVHAHAFATLETCDGDDEIKRLDLTKIYKQRADIGDCSVFW